MEEYEKITEEERCKYEVLVCEMGGNSPHSPFILRDFVNNNPNFKWLQTLSAGVDPFVNVEEFRNSPVPLTNSKGAFSAVLGEFIALGVLYHIHLSINKKERYGNRNQQKW